MKTLLLTAVKFDLHNQAHSMPKLNQTSSPKNILNVSKSFYLIFAIFYLISFLQTPPSMIEGLVNLAQMVSLDVPSSGLLVTDTH